VTWYVELITSPKTGTGDVTAIVKQFASAQAFQAATGALPSQTMPAGYRQEPDTGFPTKAAAQAFAATFNKSGVGKGATGAVPYNDYINAGLPGSNPLSGLSAIGDFFSRLTEASTWLRIAEAVLGIGLIIVGLAKLAGDSAIGRAATKAGKAALIL
jgi:hypothetical protein